MHDRSRQLIVKIKSLADEARTIRREEERALGLRRPDLVLYRDLRAHRRGIVRSVARHALLALAMIRGKPYARVEPGCASLPDWAEVRKVAERFGVVRDYALEPLYDKAGETAWAARKTEQAARFDAWLADAQREETAPKSLTPVERVATVQA